MEAAGGAALLGQQTYRPGRLRQVRIPQEGGTRQRALPAIRDRGVQGAWKRLLEPRCEADFPPGAFGSRPKQSAHDALQRGAEARRAGKPDGLDLALRADGATVRHHPGLEQVARRGNEAKVLRLLPWLLHASGQHGGPQGGVWSPRRSHLDLKEVDTMLEQAKAATRHPWGTAVEDCRVAADLVVLVDAHPRQPWRRRAGARRRREEVAKLHVEVHAETRRRGGRKQGESVGFVGLECWRIRSRSGRRRPRRTPRPKTRTALLRTRKPIFRRHRSGPLRGLIEERNPRLHGWVPYVAFGHARRCFSYGRRWGEQKGRRHLATARKRPGFGWKRWSRRWLDDTMGLFEAYRVMERPLTQAAPVG